VPEIEDVVAAGPQHSAVVVAGPGTGKSYRLEERVLSLESQGIERREIALLTLTNETVRSLRKRITEPAASTVHSYALGKLNSMGAAVEKRIADRWEQRELVRVDMKTLAAAAGHTFRVDQIDDFLTALGAGFRDTLTARPAPTPQEEVLRLAWQRVREFLALRLMDELAYDLRGLLEAGHSLPLPPRAILVDEYQDLTPEELRLIRVISEQTGAGVFAAGDDRQSIYGFREADPLGLNSFASVYGTPGPAFMSLSRRCPGRVVELAEAVADAMPVVPGLTGRPRLTSTDPGGGEVRALSFRSPSAECRWVLADIVRRLATSQAADIAVIVPRDVRFYLEEFAQEANSAGIDVSLIDPRSHPAIASDKAVRLAYALLRLTDDAEDELAWRAVLHLTRGIGPATVKDLYDTGSDRLSVAIRSRAPLDSGLQRVLDHVEQAATGIAVAADDAALRTAVETAVASLAPGLRVEWDEVLEAIGIDPSDEQEGNSRDNALASLRAVAGAAATDREWGDREIGAYTIFGAKGQQWDHVYIVGAYEQGFTDRITIADGLRLLYVALTRSKQSLTVSYPRTVRYTQLQEVLHTATTTLLPQFVEACNKAKITIERDPTPP
jgi:superfamily I DNA/RNA helicase